MVADYLTSEFPTTSTGLKFVHSGQNVPRRELAANLGPGLRLKTRSPLDVRSSNPISVENLPILVTTISTFMYFWN